MVARGGGVDGREEEVEEAEEEEEKEQMSKRKRKRSRSKASGPSAECHFGCVKAGSEGKQRRGGSREEREIQSGTISCGCEAWHREANFSEIATLGKSVGWARVCTIFSLSPQPTRTPTHPNT